MTEPTSLSPAPPPDRGRGRRLLLLWSALAVLALGAGAVVFASDDTDDPQPLSLAAGGGGDDRTASAEADAQSPMARDMAYAYVRYEAGDDLPDLGGRSDVYRVKAMTDDELRALAEALGVSGEVTTEGDSRVVREGSAEVWSYGASWSYYSGRPYPGSEDTAASCRVMEDGSEVCEAEAQSSCRVAEDGTEVCETDPSSPAPPERPEGLPTEDEAEQIVLAALAAGGIDTTDAVVTAYDNVMTWSITVDLVVDGVRALGYSAYGTVMEGGEILDLGGVTGDLERVDEYPLATTREAIDTLNEQGGWYGGGVGRDAVASSGSATEPAPGVASGGSGASDSGTDVGGDETVTDETIKDETITTETVTEETILPEPAPTPDEPPGDGPPETVPPGEEPEPTVVTLHSAEIGWLLTGSWDGRETYLVPAYVMDGASDSGEPWTDVLAVAIDADFLTPPPATAEEPSTAVEDR